MFAKSRKDQIVGQAQEIAKDLTDAIAPHVDKAREELGPRLAEARDQIAPHVETARERFVQEVVPAVQHAVDQAREQAAPVAEEARKRGLAAAAALKGEEPEAKGGKKRKLLVLAGLVGLAAVAVKKLTGGGAETQNWQSNYTPAPAPTPAPTPTPAAAAPVNEASADDAGGASPGESLSDAVEEPHAATTPDDPAETVDVSDVEDPKS